MSEQEQSSNVPSSTPNTREHNHQLSVQNAKSESNGLSSINLFNETELVAAENFIKKIIASDKSGIKTVNEGLAILLRAKDLNLPFSSCIEHIHVINGKTGVDVHIIKALLLRAGCTWRCTKDYHPLYEYTDGINVYVDNMLPDYCVRCNNQADADAKIKSNPDSDKMYVYPVKYYKDVNGNTYKEYQLNNKQFGIAANKAQMVEISKANKIPVYRVPAIPIDYVTEYEFTRIVNHREMTSIGKFTYSDAVMADMFSKDTYKKYPKIMISHRAFVLGARDIASDVLFGVMETTELKVVSNIELNDSDIIDAEYAPVE